MVVPAENAIRRECFEIRDTQEDQTQATLTSLSEYNVTLSSNGIGADAKYGEVVSGDELGLNGLSGLTRPAPARPDQNASGLEGGEFEEARRVVAEFFVFVVGEERPIILKTAVDAAILDIAYTIELARLGDRQGVQQDRVDQGEDGRGRTNSERQSQNGRCSENRGVGELPQRRNGCLS